MILLGPWIPVFRWYTGTTYIRRLPTAKIYEFKRDILLNVLYVQIAT